MRAFRQNLPLSVLRSTARRRASLSTKSTAVPETWVDHEIPNEADHAPEWFEPKAVNAVTALHVLSVPKVHSWKYIVSDLFYVVFNMFYLSLRCFSDCFKHAADGREWINVGKPAT